jgi:hypothetical protein
MEKNFSKIYFKKNETEVSSKYGLSIIGAKSRSTKDYKIQIDTNKWNECGSSFDKEFIRQAGGSLLNTRYLTRLAFLLIILAHD